MKRPVEAARTAGPVYPSPVSVQGRSSDPLDLDALSAQIAVDREAGYPTGLAERLVAEIQSLRARAERAEAEVEPLRGELTDTERQLAVLYQRGTKWRDQYLAAHAEQARLRQAVERLTNMWNESPQTQRFVSGRYSGLSWAIDHLAAALAAVPKDGTA